MPNFEAWAKYVDNTDAAVAMALKQAFEQGRALGHREGQQEEANAWWVDLDREVTSHD